MGGRAPIEAGDDGGRRSSETGGDLPKIIGANKDVAVRDNDDIMFGKPHHVDEVARLEVRPMHDGINNDLDIEMRVLHLEIARDWKRRIGRRPDTENKLQRSREILGAKRQQSLTELRLVTAKRFEH